MVRNHRLGHFDISSAFLTDRKQIDSSNADNPTISQSAAQAASLMLCAQTQLKLLNSVYLMSNHKCEDANHVITIFLFTSTQMQI